MNDTKVLQAILDNVVIIKNDVKKLEKKMDKGFKEVNNRLNKQGKSLAYLEDDAPTREEHDNLHKRVVKIEKKLAIS